MNARERLAEALMKEPLTTADLGRLQTMLGDVSDELYAQGQAVRRQEKFKMAVHNYAREKAPVFGLKYPVTPYTDRQKAAAGDGS